jgi:hypothetical protein
MAGWIGNPAEWRRELAAAVLIGLFLGAIGPFGTYMNGGMGIRVAYWVGILVVGLVLYGVGVRAALAIGRRHGQPDWFVLPAAVVVLAGPMSAICAYTVTALWPHVGPRMRPLDWYLQGLVMALPMSAILVWSRSAFPVRRAPPPGRTQALLDRLPPRLGRNLLCLQMEDHYVRVHTDRGSELILLALKDAIADLGAVEGLQVHRSWWVRREAVAEPIQRGRNLTLRLTNGLEVPVSRSQVLAVKEAGWLAQARPPSQTAAP